MEISSLCRDEKLLDQAGRREGDQKERKREERIALLFVEDSVF